MITKNTPKEEVLKLSNDCRMCGGCCTYGVGFAKPEELRKIAEYLHISEEKLKEEYFEKNIMFNKEIYKPKQKSKKENLPFGPCIFLEEKRCRIHKVKPFHCLIGNCNAHGEELTEWHFVNCLIDFEDPQSIRDWQTRIELKKTIKGGTPEEILGKELKQKIAQYKILTKEDLKIEKQKNNDEKSLEE